MINHASTRFWDWRNKSSAAQKRLKAVWNGYVIAEADKKDLIYAWYYPEPSPRSLEIVKKDYTNYVAFWHGVNVRE